MEKSKYVEKVENIEIVKKNLKNWKILKNGKIIEKAFENYSTSIYFIYFILSIKKIHS